MLARLRLWRKASFEGSVRQSKVCCSDRCETLPLRAPNYL